MLQKFATPIKFIVSCKNFLLTIPNGPLHHHLEICSETDSREREAIAIRNIQMSYSMTRTSDLGTPAESGFNLRLN
jgi:hypothetical protein